MAGPPRLPTAAEAEVLPQSTVSVFMCLAGRTSSSVSPWWVQIVWTLIRPRVIVFRGQGSQAPVASRPRQGKGGGVIEFGWICYKNTYPDVVRDR